MGLFDNIRNEILEEFSYYTGRSNFVYDSFNKNGELEIITYNSPNGNTSNNRSSNESLINLLEEKRWGYEITCVRCYSNRIFRDIRDTYRCVKCRKHFVVFTDTLLSNAKIPIQIWYDTVVAYRENNNVNSSHLARFFNVSQKTMWWMLKKLKDNPLAKENNIPILSVLLSPQKTIKRLNTGKKSYEEWENDCINKINSLYEMKNSNLIPVTKMMFFVLRNYYNKSCQEMANEMGITPENMSRYLTGQRSIKKVSRKIVEFTNNKIKSDLQNMQKITTL